jgi:hypothetical protein
MSTSVPQTKTVKKTTIKPVAKITVKTTSKSAPKPLAKKSEQTKPVKKAAKIKKHEEDDEIENDDVAVDVDESPKKGKTGTKGGLRDLDKIVDDPEGYARSISVDRLVTILQKMSDFYYGEARPLVDDEVYDVMLDVL